MVDTAPDMRAHEGVQPLPTAMTAVEITRPGGPEVLEPRQRPVPSPRPGEVLIQVAAAGVSRPDILQRIGVYPPPPGASDLPGMEAAGTIAAVGEGATRFRIGDRVTALLAGGGYAEFATAPEVQVLPVPERLSFIDAASLPENFFTVWTNVFERGGLKAGETLLVHGGASGIGTTAITLAKAFGARVLVTAGSPEKCAACERIGADRAIDYQKEDFVAETKAMTGGRGADVILDMIAGDYVPRNLEALAVEGRLVIIAFLGGAEVSFNAMRLMMKRLTVTGSTLRARAPEEKGRIAQALEREVWPLLAARTVVPVIDSTFPLREAAKAHERLESRKNIGKIVLEVNAAL